ncbi:MAG: hypothetical protein KAG06_00555 [Methylococcales bacterium]|nr:hypothetical protein [Methylococcales bacterium]
MKFLTRYKSFPFFFFISYFIVACNTSIATEIVKGPVFSAEVILSSKAKEKMGKLKEKIIISSAFSGTRKIPFDDAEGDPTVIELKEIGIEINPDETAYFNTVNFKKEEFDKIILTADGEREYELLISVYSARKAHKDNLLTCSIFMEDNASLLDHMHIKVWCGLIAESVAPIKTEVIGKAKAEYQNALKYCIKKYKVVNDMVVSGCVLEIAKEFKGTESNHPAPKLEGLVDTVGAYGQKNDRWDFSLDETSGFHLIHSKPGKKSEIFLADHVEHVSGNRYALYAKPVDIKSKNISPHSWALIYNLKTKRYDLEVKTHDKAAKKWKYVLFPAI